jgi:hypothetical protein
MDRKLRQHFQSIWEDGCARVFSFSFSVMMCTSSQRNPVCSFTHIVHPPHSEPNVQKVSNVSTILTLFSRPLLNIRSLSKLKKDPGIPNLYPYKEKLMGLIKQDHEVEQASNERQRREQRTLKQLATSATTDGKPHLTEFYLVATLLKFCFCLASAFEKKAAELKRVGNGPLNAEIRDNSRKAFYREFKVVWSIPSLCARGFLVLQKHSVFSAACRRRERCIVRGSRCKRSNGVSCTRC